MGSKGQAATQKGQAKQQEIGLISLGAPHQQKGQREHARNGRVQQCEDELTGQLSTHYLEQARLCRAGRFKEELNWFHGIAQKVNDRQTAG
jgi:hypothetical protein